MTPTDRQKSGCFLGGYEGFGGKNCVGRRSASDTFIGAPRPTHLSYWHVTSLRALLRPSNLSNSSIEHGNPGNVRLSLLRLVLFIANSQCSPF